MNQISYHLGPTRRSTRDVGYYCNTNGSWDIRENSFGGKFKLVPQLQNTPLPAWKLNILFGDSRVFSLVFMMNLVSIFSSPRMNGTGNGKISGSKRNSNNGNGKNPAKSQHNHLNKPQSMDAFFFENTSTVSTMFPAQDF